MWIYQARPSTRSSDFGELRPLLRQLLGITSTVQLRRRRARIELLQEWPNLRLQHDVAELMPYITDQIQTPGFRAIWEARTMQGPGQHTHLQMHSFPQRMRFHGHPRVLEEK